jgi:hypothetical protein
MSKAFDKIAEGLCEALAFSRVQKLIDKEERKHAKNGRAALIIDSRLAAFKEAQALFGMLVKPKGKKAR